MSVENGDHEEGPSLRQRAEALIKDQFDKLPEMSTDEILHLMTELRTHQIELELQNEELRRAQAEATQARDRFSDLYDFAPIGYVTVSSKGLIDAANLRLAEMLGVERRSLIKQRLSAFVLELDQDIYFQHKRVLGQTDQPQSCELRLQTTAGQSFWARLDSVTTMYDNVSQLQIAVTDVSAHRHFEEHCRQEGKMRAIGQLAAGIAHDFNNMLSGIIASIELAQHELERDNPARTHLELAKDSCFQSTGLTRRLLAFAKGGTPMTGPMAVVDLMRQVADLALSGSNVRADIHDPDGVWPVEADRSQIHQVLLNLLINAREAMPDGGTITMHAANEDRSSVSDGVISPGRYVRVTVCDTGTGIAEADLPKVFELFYTTKTEGNGLGLATCFRIISQHGGQISVESTPEAGSTFTFYLPAADDEPARQGSEESHTPRGVGRILFMDDEEVLRKTSHTWLTSKGYDVEVAADGETALALYTNAMLDEQPFDIVLLDLTVRDGMGGADTMKKLLAVDPDVKAVVMSGYSDSAIMAACEAHGFLAALAKPFPFQDLTRTIDRILTREI